MGQVNKVFYELKFSGKLPSPAAVGMKILQLTQQEDCGLDEITKVVRADPSLTGRILKVASAGIPKSGASRAPLEEAVLKLGLSTLRDLVLGFSLISTTSKGGCAGFDYSAFWHTSLGRAVAAQTLTERSGREAASECYVCGLLCGIGELGLAAAHAERYGKLLQSNPAAQSNAARAVLESREFGIHHGELTEALLRDWGFPERLSHAAAHYWQPISSDGSESERLVALRRTLAAAQRVVNHLQQAAAPNDPLPEPLRQELVELGLDADGIPSAMAAIRTAWSEWGTLLNVSAPKPAVRTEAPAASPANTTAASSAPVVPPEAASGPPAEGKSVPSPVDLLLFDPEQFLARTPALEKLIKSEGKAVAAARTAAEALEMAMNRPVRVVIAHEGGTSQEALELCAALRKFEAGRLAYFILATPRSSPEQLTAAFEKGADDYLRLPIDPTELELRLRAAHRTLELRARLSEQEASLQQNLAELAVANRKLHRAAMTDELTQLPNRRFAEETMREGWVAASTTDEDLSLIFGDIDHFKRINDTYGHMVGDMVLATVARVFRQELRSTDVACRLGGEEFLVICPKTDLPSAQKCAERLRARIAATPITVSGQRHQVTISMGVAARKGGCQAAKSVDQVLKAADTAVYESKRTGRNRVSLGQVSGT